MGFGPSRNRDNGIGVATRPTATIPPVGRNQPIWSIVRDAAQRLTDRGRVPFSRLELLEEVRHELPSLQRATFDPTVQGMTSNAIGGPPGRGAGVLIRIARGQYRLTGGSSRSGMTAPSQIYAAPIEPRRDSGPSEASARLADVKASFAHYLEVYDREVPFT